MKNNNASSSQKHFYQWLSPHISLKSETHLRSNVQTISVVDANPGPCRFQSNHGHYLPDLSSQ
jgi:hypothetical protein